MRLSLFSLIILLGFLIISCSSSSPTENEVEQPQPPAFATIPDFIFTFPDDYPEDIYTSEDVEYQEEIVVGYSLDQFVPIDLGNGEWGNLRPLYAYEIVGSDGFTPRMRVDQDLHWTLFSNGYLLPDKEHRTFISSSSALRPYNVKFAETINLYRKIDVLKGDNDPVMFEIMSIETLDLGSTEVIPMSSFISDYITVQPENYSYKLININNHEFTFTWSEFSLIYWLVNDEIAILPIPDEMSPDLPIIYFLKSIELHEL